MLPDRVSNPGPLTYKSGALPIAPGHFIRPNDIYTDICGWVGEEIRPLTKSIMYCKTLFIAEESMY